MMVEFADEPELPVTPEQEAAYWLSAATIRRMAGAPQVAMPEVVLEGIIKLMSPPGTVTAGDLTSNPVIHAAYASIGEALYGWGPHKMEDNHDG